MAIVARLGKATEGAAHGVSDRLRRTGDHAQSAAVNAVWGDAAGVGPIGSHHFDGGRADSDSHGQLFGLDLTGQWRQLEADDVHSVRMNDAEGNPIGVSFPLGADDVGKITDWAQAEHRDDWRVYAAEGSGTEWRHSRDQEAPWAKDVEAGRPPIYINAHSSEEYFVVQATLGPPGSKKTTLVLNGENYGKLVAANSNFRRAADLHPESPLVMISCNAGAPGAHSARTAARSLHASGHANRDIHAPTAGFVTNTSADGHSSRLGILPTYDAAGNELPRIKTFPAPSRSTTAPDPAAPP
ncbi:hypothetical protein [Nocardia sp. NPDC051463]|uniref:hypothetical protein n=1 Tax=Nocardia sp. NPDC051463 TaxID=3154845 RepID=UPI003447EB41